VAARLIEVRRQYAVANEAVARLADADVTMPGKRKQRQLQIIATIALLAERYPNAFFVLGKQRKPLQVGIANHIEIDDVVRLTDLRWALGAYCCSPGYLRSFQAGVPRLDLDGNAAGIVTEAEADHARRKLDEVLARRQRKPQPQATAGTQLEQKRAAADPGRAIAAAVNVALDIAAEAQKRAAGDSTSQPKRITLADLKRAAARRRETAR
jgi:sRNA-binding protein